METFEGKNFLSAANKMLMADSPKGTEQWFRVGPGLRKVEPPRQDRSPKREKIHSDGEIGLYTEAEEFAPPL